VLKSFKTPVCAQITDNVKYHIGYVYCYRDTIIHYTMIYGQQ